MVRSISRFSSASARSLRITSAWACCASASLALLVCRFLRSSADFSLFGLQNPGDRVAGLLGLCRDHLAALGGQPLRDLVFNLFTSLGDRVLLLAQGLGLPGDLRVLGGQLLVKALPRFLEERPASDSVSLISWLQLGQCRVGSCEAPAPVALILIDSPSFIRPDLTSSAGGCDVAASDVHIALAESRPGHGFSNETARLRPQARTADLSLARNVF